MVSKQKITANAANSNSDVLVEILVGKFKQTTISGQKPKMKPLEIYLGANNSLAFAPEMIEVEGKKYHLNFPLRCLLDKEDDFHIVKCEMLDLIGTGKTEADAKESFAQEFGYIFQRYNELDDDRLAPRLRTIKTFLNLTVKSVE